MILSDKDLDSNFKDHQDLRAKIMKQRNELANLNLTDDQQAKLKILKSLNDLMEKLKLEFTDNLKRMEIIAEESEKLQVYKTKLFEEGK